MDQLIYLVPVAIGLLAWYLHGLSTRDPIHTLSEEDVLPWYQRQDFRFRVSFPDEAAALRCAGLVSFPRLACAVAATPNGLRWAVEWSIRARAAGPWYRKVTARIAAAARQCGISEPLIVATANEPGSAVGFLLQVPDNELPNATGQALKS